MTLTRGGVPVRGPSPDRRPVEASDNPIRLLAMPIAGLAALLVLTPLHGSWAVQVLMVPLLLIVPGAILMRALQIPGKTVATNPIYVPSASIVILMGSGLVIDLVGPVFGISAPLRTAPLLITLELVCTALLLCSWNAPPETRIPLDALDRPIALAWPLILPLIGAAGALRLNSGHSNAIAVIAIILVIITLIVTFISAPWCDDGLLIVILFATALSLMWSFSLRGDLVYGFDISNEYNAMNQAVTTGIWHLSHPNDAYGAMLSVTILPAELHAISGVPALLILKVVDPLIGSLFPVGVFCLGRRILAGRWAFLAGALVVMQQSFFQQLVALTRQEIATLLFAALIASALDTTQPKRSRWIFVGLLSLGMVVAHYSTAYMAIPLLAMAVAFQWVVSWFRPSVPRMSGAVLLAACISIGGATVWYGSLTHSTSNVSQFAQAMEGQGIDVLPNQGGNPLSTFLQGEAVQQLSPAQYQTYISGYYKSTFPFITPLPDASDPQYDLKAAPYLVPPVTMPAASNDLNLIDLLIEQLVNVLTGVAALLLVLRRKLRTFASQIGILGLGSVVILILTRVSGTIANAYNPQRAFLQLLIVLAVAICWMFAQLGAKYKWTRPWILVICSASLGLSLLGATGVTGIIFGGGPAANLADNYEDYENFVVYGPDLAAAQWLLTEAPANALINGDRYGDLRLVTLAGERSGMFGDVVPQTINQNAWVYATRTNLVDNIAESDTGAYTGVYAFPKKFLDSNFNVVYTNGTSEVFHR
jgi:uncharacterized membrane protein